MINKLQMKKSTKKADNKMKFIGTQRTGYIQNVMETSSDGTRARKGRLDNDKH